MPVFLFSYEGVYAMAEWYDNKELFEMLQSLKSEILELKTELTETKTLIRDYNGLREKITQTDTRLNTLMWVAPILVAILSFISTFIFNLIKK